MPMQLPPKYSNIFEYLEENYGLDAPDTPLTRLYKSEIAEIQYPNLDGPVTKEKILFEDRESAAEMVRSFAKGAGADIVGFTSVKGNFVFEDQTILQKNCVVLAVEMDYDLIETAPESPSGTEVLRAYWYLADIAIKVARFIRSMGYPAQAHHPRSYADFPPTILQTVAAIEAGMGELGRHGVLITPEFGPRVRVATVTTDLELPKGGRKEFGVDKFCSGCHVCYDACEGDAIPMEKTVVRGHRKYTIDPYKCLPEFAKYDGCNICVARCVFNKRPEALRPFIRTLD